jgi:uncharacterized membrane protein
MRADAPSPASMRWSLAIVALFALFTVVTSIWQGLIPGGLVGIVNTLLLVAFALVHGIATYGGRTMVWFIVICLVVSNVAENASIVTGFPFGHYHYTDILGSKLFLVPVTIGGAYFGAGYLAWVVALSLVGRAGRAFDGYARWAVPAVAAGVMSSWDFMLDPIASTIDKWWVWEQGGGYFGVPFSNYLGWLLTVFVFFAVFAAIVLARSRGAAPGAGAPAGFWIGAVLMYALLGVRYVLVYAVPSVQKTYVDAAGHLWLKHDIYETAALSAIFTCFAFSLLAVLRLKDPARG